MIKFTCSLIALASALTAGAVSAQTTGLHLTQTVKIGGNGRWDYITVNDATKTIYAAHETAISSYDLKTGKANPHLADANGAHIALPVHNGADLLITHGKDDRVTINDAGTGAVKASIKTDAKPDAAILEPVTGKAFVMANGGNAVDAIDLGGNSLAMRINVGGAAESAAVDGKGLVFTHLEDKNAFVVIDAGTLALKKTFAMKDCEEPSGIAFVSKGRLILSACQNGIARVSEADTGKEVATVKVGAHPDAALYDASKNLGFIPSADGKLTVISFDGKPHVVEVIATRAGAKTAVLDEATHQIFLPTAELGPIDPATKKPAIVPDTFMILTVAR